jgi:hypothetical protein
MKKENKLAVREEDRECWLLLRERLLCVEREEPI